MLFPTGDEPARLTGEVRDAYRAAYQRFMQTKAAGKPVSPKYINDKLAPLDQPSGPEKETFWTKLANYCLSHGLDPDRLARAFFMQKANTTSFMLLRHEGIFHASVLSVYEQLKPTVDMCREKLRLQTKQLDSIVNTQAVMSGIPPSKSRPAVMLMLTAEFCPLFRYCVLRQENSEDAQRWFLAAVAQYRPDRLSYDTAWGDFIPEDVRQAASKRR